MSLLKKIERWGDHHHPRWIDYFRIALGTVLIWKGVSFYINMEAFNHLMRGEFLATAFGISLIAHLIILSHILGGLAIAIGTHTRLSCLINLPILIGAVFFINMSNGIFQPYSEFWLSTVVLIGLVCFIVEGNGVIAVDRFERAEKT
ncbi:DoxX family protein [Pedobacter sandarakinus]|uniref:DoxX family protein n=1 Tax=Pedobacter sandarakinus TaxID=353156 RepID=UPI0022461E05|nr:DoxX family protein [Pedobacter sandarakinus]MCX2575892.1 DoxX family protein [Pedobacter sandarakinus]